MEDQTTIKLKIPRQDFTGLPLFQPTIEAADSWVQTLPVTNTKSLIQLLGQALSDLNRMKLSPEVRYNIMETLRPNLEVGLSNLSKRFLNQPLIMPQEPARMAQLSNELLTLATTAYTIVAIEAIQQRDAIRETNPARLTCQAIHRALVFAGLKVLRNFQLHKAMDIRGWQRLHQLYMLAETQQLADLPVPEPLSGGTTIKATYLQALIMGCCKPNQLRQTDLAALYRALQQWSELVKLNSQKTGDDLFLVDLDSDQPPLYSALYRNKPNARCRYINTAALTEHLKKLKAGTGGKAVSLDKDTSIPFNLLDHLAAALGSMSLRNFKRTVTGNALWICVGLSSTHYHCAGERTFEQVLYSEEDLYAKSGRDTGNPFLATRNKVDVWQIANPGDYASDVKVDSDTPVDLDAVTKARLMLEADVNLPANERYPVFKVQLADASPGGYCLEWDADLPGDVRAGDIMGLKEEEHKEWVIAVIRWLSRLKDAKTLIGLELLSPRAIAYGARIHQKNGEKSPPMRVLLLPEIKLVGQPQTLITPRTGFKERQKITIGNSAGVRMVQLLRHIASTGSFSQFEFHYTQELGDVLADNTHGHHGGEFDSLWSNI
ncbi:MAG: GTPase [Halioglobus sp.]